MDLAISIGAALTVDKFGRRPLFLVAMTGMGTSSMPPPTFTHTLLFSIFLTVL